MRNHIRYQFVQNDQIGGSSGFLPNLDSPGKCSEGLRDPGKGGHAEGSGSALSRFPRRVSWVGHPEDLSKCLLLGVPVSSSGTCEVRKHRETPGHSAGRSCRAFRAASVCGCAHGLMLALRHGILRPVLWGHGGARSHPQPPWPCVWAL